MAAGPPAPTSVLRERTWTSDALAVLREEAADLDEPATSRFRAAARELQRNGGP